MTHDTMSLNCEPPSQFSEINTPPSVYKPGLRGKSLREACSRLFERYRRAIRGYARGLLRGDEAAADDICGEMAKKIIQGDFSRVRREDGKFRYIMKHAVRDTVRAFQREGRRLRFGDGPLTTAAVPPSESPTERGEVKAGRCRVVGRALRKMLRGREGTRVIDGRLIRLMTADPQARPRDLAARLRQEMKTNIKDATVRKRRQRIRDNLAVLLLAEVQAEAESRDPRLVEEKLIELELLAQIGDFLPEGWRDRRDPSGR
jgi:DNA-directed RNA polymerase specialized sigma24 family protein